jgi:hypothetical protein
MSAGFAEKLLDRVAPESTTVTLGEWRRRNLPEPAPDPKKKGTR